MPTNTARFELVEKCSCDAEFSVVDDGLSIAYEVHMRALRAWRKAHLHDVQAKGARGTRGASAIGFPIPGAGDGGYYDDDDNRKARR